MDAVGLVIDRQGTASWRHWAVPHRGPKRRRNTDPMLALVADLRLCHPHEWTTLTRIWRSKFLAARQLPAFDRPRHVAEDLRRDLAQAFQEAP
jgi:hypothetical protein